MRNHVLILGILWIALAVTLWGAETGSKEQKPGVEKRMAELFAEFDRMDRPGGVVAVVMGGSVVYQKGHGLANLEYNIPNTPKTVFDVASAANAFTGMAIAMLEQAGKISRDDDIRKYIPEVPDFGKTITLRHLLYHTSGLMDWPKRLILAGWKMEDVISFDDIMKIVQAQKKPDFEPGTKYSYSKTNYNLLAEVVKRVTGQSFRDWTWENIFRPLGMTKTLFHDSHREIIENRAYSYNFHTSEGYRKGADNLSAVGSGGLFTTPEDLGKWIQNLETRKVGGTIVIQKMMTPGTLNSGKEIDYGYGLNISTYKGLKRVTCGGSWGGFRSALHYFPDQFFGVVVLVNWDYQFEYPEGLAQEVADIYLESHLQAEKPTEPPQEREKIKVAPAIYDQYLGNYRLRPGILLAVTREGDHLLVTPPRSGPIELFPESETGFFLQIPGSRITFQKNDEGKVHQLILHQGGQDTAAPKVELVKPTPQELQEYTGTYYCKELDASYTIILRNDQPVMTHHRHPDIHLTPEARDHFLGDSQYFPMVVFARDKQQKITGYTIDSDQIRDIFFEKE